MIAPAAFMAKVRITDTCWLWTGATQSRGYGSFGWRGRTHLAHRLAFTFWSGPIPDGLTINHMCGVKTCINPHHLEAVTIAENLRHARQTGLAKQPVIAARNAAKTHCPQGHPYSGDNLALRAGGRVCLTCRREHDRKRYQARMTARSPRSPREVAAGPTGGGARTATSAAAGHCLRWLP